MTDRQVSQPRLPRVELDAFDLALIDEVMRDGRATYEALARAIGLSRPATRARMRRLLESNVLQVVGVVHPSVFGLRAYAHLAVTVEGEVRQVAERIAALDEAPFVSTITGRYSLVAEVRCTSQATLAATVRRVAALPRVRDVDSTVYTAILKDANYPPRPYSPTALDDVDRRLLALLQKDGRAPFAGLAVEVGLSTGAARTRVLRLLESGAVHVGARLNPNALGPAQVTGFELGLGEGAQTAIERIRRLSQVQYLATAMGRCDAVGTAVSHSAEGTFLVLETIRATPGVRSVQSWTHLHILKESYDHSPLLTEPQGAPAPRS